MEIYLVRHTTPDIEKGICYGQSDIVLAKSFSEEAKQVLNQLPDDIDIVYTSPLKRCVELTKLIPCKSKEQVPQLMEMNFGDWELKPWEDIPKQQLQPWMEDFVNHQVPNGESMKMMALRVNRWYQKLLKKPYKKVVVVFHAGPIRVVLSEVNKTPLKEAFERYPIQYGQIIGLDTQNT